MLHELAHILDRPTLYEDRHGEDPDKLRFETIVAAYGADQPPPPHLPAYWGHGEAFIRIVLHLSYRAKRIGVEVPPSAMFVAHRYGLSHTSDYQDDLDDEPERCIDLSFRDILTQAPPPGFSQRWARDVAAYNVRSSHFSKEQVHERGTTI